MAFSAGALGTSTVAAAAGVVLMILGIPLFASGPLFSTSHEENSGLLGIGGSQSSSASVNLLPVLGIVFVLIGAAVLLVGLKGAMHTFERGRERDEGTRHHLTIERK